VEPTPKHKSLAVASGATPIGNAVRAPDEIIKKKREKKREESRKKEKREQEEKVSIFLVI
jgi:ribosomal protein L12E/L44/L45/RPP1/RPP2